MLREFISTLLEYTDACRYESSIIKSLKAAGVQGYMKRAACDDSSRPDADIRVNGEVYYIEVKSHDKAQMGGGSIGYSLRDKKFYPVGQNRDLSGMIVDVLNDMNDTSLQKGLSTLLKHLSQANEKRFVDVPVSGFSPESWDEIRDFGLLQAINRTFESDISVIAQHYARKQTYYIQIGGAGFFRLGEENPANLPVPVLNGRVKLELRLAKAGERAGVSTAAAGLRVQARLYARNSSPYTLEDPDSIKQMMTKKRR